RSPHPAHRLRADDHAGWPRAGAAPRRGAQYADLPRAGRGRAAEPGRRPDETGWKVGGRLWWLWVFVTRDVTVYAIQPGRGYAQAAAILGPRYHGIVVRDGWAPYRKLAQATHQTCLAHLLRRCHALLEIAQRGAARFPHAVRRGLLAALAIRERRDAGELVGHGLAVAIGRLEARTDRLLAGRVTHPPNRRLLRHLQTERPALF